MASGTALGQGIDGEPGRKDQRQQAGMQAMPVVEQFMRALRRLDLDDDQREGVRTIMKDLKEDIRPVMAEAKAGQQKLKELIKAASYDKKAVAALAEKEGKLATERMMITSKALSEVFGLLTEEQRSELDALAEERIQRRGERRKQRSEES